MATSSITKNFVYQVKGRLRCLLMRLKHLPTIRHLPLKLMLLFNRSERYSEIMQKRKKRMQEVSKYTVFNIREYLNGNNEELGEDDLRQVLSEFSCEKNPDVERFAKEQSIEFAKKQQSVTYLVFSTEDAELVGYFAITIKPITVNAESFSNTIKKN